MQGDKSLRVVHAINAKSHTAVVSSGAIDCLGYSLAHVVVNLGTGGAGFSKAVTVLESDSTTAASFAHVAGSSFTALTTAISNASQIGVIDLRKRKRYINVKMAATNATATLAAANVVLSQAKVIPVTASATLAFLI